MAEVRDVKWVVQQSMVEMGLPKPNEVVTSQDATVQQMLALLNRAGNDMVLGFPWEQLIREWIITTEDGKSEYDMPSDWSYFIDQTQWDRTNHWPLLGPKTAQEWQWLKGGLLSSGPRLRYRVVAAKFEIWPVPSPSNTPVGDSNITGVFAPGTLAMEYVADTWLKDVNQANTYYASVQSDTRHRAAGSLGDDGLPEAEVLGSQGSGHHCLHEGLPRDVGSQDRQEQGCAHADAGPARPHHAHRDQQHP